MGKMKVNEQMREESRMSKINNKIIKEQKWFEFIICNRINLLPLYL